MIGFSLLKSVVALEKVQFQPITLIHIDITTQFPCNEKKIKFLFNEIEACICLCGCKIKEVK